MQKILFLLIIVISFGSCKKEQTTSLTEPNSDDYPLRIITSDTITNGQWWNLNISDTITNIYKTIQQIQSEKQIYYLGIVNSVFTKFEELENAIPLYSTISLNEKNGSDSGIQIYFTNNKVHAIWTNAGVKLSKWPSNTGKSATIAKGDPIENIYSKLENIKHNVLFANIFERISLFSKDINKAYDPHMSASPQWQLSATVIEKRFYVVHLNFSLGILTSIYVTLYEKY